MELESLLATLVAFFIVAVSPGPANIAVASVAAKYGRSASVRFGLGLSVGLAFWGCIAATGLGAVLQNTTHVLVVLKVVGGLYLVWLAWQSGKSAISPNRSHDPDMSHGAWFLRGLILNLSNPKAVVAWMAALSMGLGTQDAPSALMVTTLLCMALGVVNYLGHAAIFSLRTAMHAYDRSRRAVDGIVAALFAVGGLGLLRSALTRS